MKKIIFIFIIICLSKFSSAQETGLGVGIMLGEPTGFSAKKWLSSTSAIDGGLAWSFVNDGSMQIHGDYLFHFPDFISKPKLTAYLGVGGRIKFKGNDKGESSLGIRIPAGLTYIFPDAPFDAFVEVAPVFDLTPETRSSFNSAIGVRYYFK